MRKMANFPGLIEDRRRYWTVRVRVPAPLQPIIGRKELWRSTGTAVKSEADKLYLLIRAELDARLLDAKRQAAAKGQPAQPRPVTEAELHQLVRAWFHRWNKGADDAFQMPSECELSHAFQALDEDEGNAGASIEEPGIQEVADKFIKEHSLAIERGSRDWWKTVRLMQGVTAELIHRNRARMNGAIAEEHFHPFFAGITASGPAPQPPERAAPVPIDTLFDAWTTEVQHAEKTTYGWKRIVAKLKRHLGHNDTAKISDLDIIAWKDALISSRLSPKTIKNHLVVVNAFFGWAARNKKIPHNPAAHVEYRPKLDPSAGRLSYSDDDAQLILIAARKERQAHKRWVPWLCAFTGARIDEICGAMVNDIGMEGDIHFIRIDPANREERASVKNKGSIRNVPLHTAIIAEGFLDYVNGLPKAGPLFPNVTPDRFGKRGGNGTKTIGRWVRDKVGITDKRKAPNHSWRHRFADQCRRVGISREVRFALDGHAAKEVGDRYGSEGFPIALLAEAVAKLGNPLDQPTHSVQPVAPSAA